MPMPFSFSQVDIANDALDQLAQPNIVSMDPPSDKTAEKCYRIFNLLLFGALRDHKWNFATKRIQMVEDATPPVNKWAHSFHLPDDCVRAWKINDDDHDDFKIEGRSLMTNLSSAILEYVYYCSDPNLWDGIFRMAFVQFMASWLCMPLTRTLKSGEFYGMYQRLLTDSKSVDGQEQTIETYEVSEIHAIRDW